MFRRYWFVYVYKNVVKFERYWWGEINILEFFFLNFLNMFILCKVLYIGLLRNEYEIFNNLVCIKYCKNMRKYILVLRCDNLLKKLIIVCLEKLCLNILWIYFVILLGFGINLMSKRNNELFDIYILY